MATTNDNSDDVLTVPDLRSRLIAAAHGEPGDVYGSKPLIEATQRRLYHQLAGEKLDDDLNSNQVQLRLLEEVGKVEDAEEYVKRGHSPFRKSELETIWHQIDNGGADWGPVGTESVDGGDDEREFREPEATERRFQVLASLAVHGPATAKELIAESSVPRESITSELPRLYKDYMAGRTKNETFDDVYKYWIRPDGHDVVEGVVNIGGTAEHEELHSLYGDGRKDE